MGVCLCKCITHICADNCHSFNAASDQNIQEAGCSTQLAYACAIVVIALPYLLAPLHVPRAFCVLLSLKRYIRTNGSTVGGLSLPSLSFLGGGPGMGSPNIFYFM